MTVSINGTSGLVFNDASTQNTSAFTGGLGFRNRIINGAMVIDQRNAGASVSITAAVSFIADRWNAYSDLANMTGQRTQSTVPVGFTYALGITVGTGASPTTGQISRLEQRIEGFNFGDMYWGGASAQSVALSFWVRTSVTGTHSGALVNSAGNRSYPFTFSVSSANTWEYKTVIIAGDQSGTWLTDNGTGCKIVFNLGTGSTYLGAAGAWAASNFFGATGSVQLSATSGATFYITGVQLEKGSTATSFDYRPYGTELQLCQRYLQKFGANQFIGSATVRTGGVAGYASLAPKVDMRSQPTITSSGTPIIYVGDTNASITGYNAGDGSSSLLTGYTSSAAGIVGQSGLIYTNSGGSITFSAEL
jgi:hypothetical protein